YFFTFMLYARPNEYFPTLEAIPFAKIAAIIAPLAYIYVQLQKGKPVIKWTTEVKMILVIIGLAICIAPFAKWPGGTFEILQEPFLKVVIIHIVMSNVTNNLNRLYSLLKLMVASVTFISFHAVRAYMNGELGLMGMRIQGVVNGMFGNPNDLATAV